MFKAITAKHPETAKLPGLVYYCARIAQAETAAARVPVLEKELGETKTKLTELEALTNPTPSGGVQRQPAAKSSKDMTPDEQFKQLQSEAKMIAIRCFEQRNITYCSVWAMIPRCSACRGDSPPAM